MVFDGTSVYKLTGPVALRAEDTYGTRDAANTAFDVVAEEGAISPFSDYVETGGIRDSLAPKGWYKNMDWVVCTLRGKLTNSAVLAMACGDASDTGPVGSVYTHTIKPIRQDTGGSAVYPQPYTIEGQYKKPDGSTSVSVSALGSTSKDIRVNCSLEQKYVSYVLNAIAKTTGSTVSLPSAESSVEFGKWNTKVSIDSDATAYSSGSQLYGLNSVEFYLNLGLPDPNMLGEFNSQTMDRQPYPNKRSEGDQTARLVRKYIDGDFVDIVQPFSLRVEMERTADEDEIQVDINNCVFTDPRGKFLATRVKDIEDHDLSLKYAELIITSKDTTPTYSGGE